LEVNSQISEIWDYHETEDEHSFSNM